MTGFQLNIYKEAKHFRLNIEILFNFYILLRKLILKIWDYMYIELDDVYTEPQLLINLNKLLHLSLNL